MVKERPVVINLHNPTHLIIWQYTLLISAFFGLGTSLNINILAFGILTLSILSLSASLFFKSRPLILTSTALKLPQGTIHGCAPQSVLSLRFIEETTLEIEIGNQNEKTKEKLDLNYLSKEDANRLWLWIAKHLSHAQIDSQTRGALLNWQQYRILPTEESTDNENSSVNTQLELTFIPQSLLSASSGRRSLLIKTLGQIWLTLCLICSAILLAVSMNLGTPKDTFDYHPLYGFLENLTPVVFNRLCPVEILGTIAIGITILLIICAVLRQIRPNSLFIDHLGLTLQYRQLVSSQTDSYSTIFHSHIPWLAIGSIKLCKAFPLSTTSDCLLFERTENKSSFRLPLNFMQTPKEKQLLLALLQKYQQNHDYQIDKAVIDALKNSSDYVPEYTQLWLKSFQQKQEQKVSHSVTDSVRQPNLEIIQEIASGGQATTYIVKKRSAYQNNEKVTAEEMVVLKEFFLPTKNEAIYKTQIDKFEKTAAHLKKLHHPNLVRIDSYFVDGPRACLLLEYIEGTTLAESVSKDGVFSETKAVNLALTMCDILIYLHAQNPPLLHLDFTPDNLILDKKDQLKLIDLDCCQVHDNKAEDSQNSHGTKRRTVIGKKNYIPREQFQGRPDNRSDIFGLGATLFFLTTGQKPNPLAILSPQKYNLVLSEGFNAIVAKAAAVFADDRYSSAEELKTEFLLLKESLEANYRTNSTTALPPPIRTPIKKHR